MHAEWCVGGQNSPLLHPCAFTNDCFYTESRVRSRPFIRSNYPDTRIARSAPRRQNSSSRFPRAIHTPKLLLSVQMRHGGLIINLHTSPLLILGVTKRHRPSPTQTHPLAFPSQTRTIPHFHVEKFKLTPPPPACPTTASSNASSASAADDPYTPSSHATHGYY